MTELFALDVGFGMRVLAVVAIALLLTACISFALMMVANLAAGRDRRW